MYHHYSNLTSSINTVVVINSSEFMCEWKVCPFRVFFNFSEKCILISLCQISPFCQILDSQRDKQGILWLICFDAMAWAIDQEKNGHFSKMYTPLQEAKSFPARPRDPSSCQILGTLCFVFFYTSCYTHHLLLPASWAQA